MANKLEGTPRKRRHSKGECKHYWIIESPSGPKSRGVCKYCGATKEFDNYWPYSTWDRESSSVLELPGIRSIKPEQLDDC